jgi:molecular chaperone DnaK (HSP70)
VLRKPIGITTAGGVFSELVPAGQRLPHTRSMTFGNATNGREEVLVELSQKDSAGVETIASLRIPIPRAANKTLDITVTLMISAEKTMRVKTTVAQTASVKEFGPYPVT